MKTNRLLAGAAVTALASLLATGAIAQSTGTQVQEVIVTGARQARSLSGIITQVNEAKDESIVDQQYFTREVGSSNIGNLINLLPGVTYSSEDPSGLTSGDFRMHGFDGNRIAVLIDGSPVNDTGNYAIFFGEYTPSEVIDHITVNIGATDVDSPTAASLGGQINVTTKVPGINPGVRVKYETGSFNYNRLYAEVNTGSLGPFGTRAYLSAHLADTDKWKGSGDEQRMGVDGRVYQPLKGTDFVSVAFSYARERLHFYQSASPAQIAGFGRKVDYNSIWIEPTRVTGRADTVPGANSLSSDGVSRIPFDDTNYFEIRNNPVDFATIRGTSKFSLTDKLTLTVDPSFFYTLANGGGATGIRETDPRLIGNTNNGAAVTGPNAARACVTAGRVTGVDLNGDSDCLDTVALYTPNNTNTRRYTILSSLIYQINASNSLQVAYTYDYGRHRQTGEYGYLYGGVPEDVFGGKDGYGQRVYTADGSFMRGRDRYSVAKLNQLSLNYVGRFVDDKIHVNLGVRLPYFQRDLNQYCYTYSGTSATCSTNSAVPGLYTTAQAAQGTTAQTAALAALNTALGVTVAYNRNPDGTIRVVNGLNQLNFRPPFSATYKYDKPLPNLGITYRPFEHHLVYASYAKGFAAPRTDNLYTSSPAVAQPETSDIYTVGYRFQTPMVQAAAAVWRNNFHNRIITSPDPNDPTLSIDRNLGDVQLQGIDLEAGTRILEHLTLYGSATFQDSEVKGGYFSNLTVNGVATPTLVPVQGKQLVLATRNQYALRAQYELGPASVGAETKYQGSRYVDDINSMRIPAFATTNLDARYRLSLGPFDRSYIQVNVLNLFNRKYVSRSTTAQNYTPIVTANGTIPASSGPFYYLGFPTAVTVTLNAQF